MVGCDRCSSVDCGVQGAGWTLPRQRRRSTAGKDPPLRPSVRSQCVSVLTTRVSSGRPASPDPCPSLMCVGPSGPSAVVGTVLVEIDTAPAVVGNEPVVVGTASAVVGTAPVVVGTAPTVVGTAPAVVGTATAIVGTALAVVGTEPARLVITPPLALWCGT